MIPVVSMADELVGVPLPMHLCCSLVLSRDSSKIEIRRKDSKVVLYAPTLLGKLCKGPLQTLLRVMDKR